MRASITICLDTAAKWGAKKLDQSIFEQIAGELRTRLPSWCFDVRARRCAGYCPGNHTVTLVWLT